MPDPGDVVLVDFAGATGIKRRPAVVLSSDFYHANRPDLILGVLTTQLASAARADGQDATAEEPGSEGT